MADDVDAERVPPSAGESPWWLVAAAAPAVAVALACAGFAINQHLCSDHFEHAAAVRAFMDNATKPHHPLFAVDAPHAFLSPYTWFWARAARRFGTTAIDIFVAAAALNVIFFYWSVYSFLLRAAAKPWAAFAMAIPLTLFAWGRGPWLWSGFFHYPALLYAASYPSTFAGALVFCALAVAWDLRTSRLRLLLLIGIAALCWSVHAMTGVMLTACVGTLTLARMPALDRRSLVDVAVIGAGLVLAFFIAAQWPYFSLIDLVTSPDNHDFDRASHVLYTYLAQRMWPLIVFVALTLVRLKENRRDPFALLLLVCGAIYACGALSREGLGRSISWVALFAQLGGAASISSVVADLPRRFRNGALIATVLFALLGIAVIYGPSTRPALPGMPKTNSGRDVLEMHPLHGEVVMTDLPFDSPIPALGGRMVAWRHPVYWIPDLEDRRVDVASFFARSTSPEERIAILRRYNARYIFVEKRRHPPVLFLEVGKVIAQDAEYALLAVHPDVLRLKAKAAVR